MINVVLVDGINPIVDNLFKFVKKNDVNLENINSKFSYFVENEIKKEDIDLYKSVLKDFSFYDINMYKVKDTSDSDRLFELILTLSNFKGQVLDYLSKPKKVNYKKIGKLERQVSPPLEAYEYIGNNKTDINYSNKSYGLLFE